MQEWIAGLGAGRIRLHVRTGAFGRLPSTWHHRRRTLGMDILYGVTEGTIRIAFDTREIRAPAGTVFWIAAGVPHGLALAEGCRRVSAWHARVEACTATGVPVRMERDHLLARGPALVSLAADLMREARATGPHAPLRFQAVAVLLTTALVARADAAVGGFDDAQEGALRRALEQDHPQHPLRPRDLAQAVQLAPAYFARRFRAHFGCTPRHWILRHRLHRAAAHLLEQPAWTIGQVAAACGFADLAPFSRLFHRELGMPPSRFRTRHGT